MADIANIGFRADTSGLSDAKAKLDALPPAAQRAERSSDKLGASLTKVDAAADKMASAAAGLSGAADKLNAVLEKQYATTNKVVGAAQGYSSVNAKLVMSVTSAAAGINKQTIATDQLSATTNVAKGSTEVLTSSIAEIGSVAQRSAAGVQLLDNATDQAAAGMKTYITHMNGAIVGTENYNAHVMAYRNNLKGVSDQLKFTAREGLNATRQLSDIGVTLAMGMNPFMIALQQGPQLFDIIQEKAIASGQTIGSVFKAAGVAIWTALAPLLPILAGIALTVGAVAAGFGLAARQITKDNGDVTQSMELSKSQAMKLKDHLDRLKDNKINVEVTGMDSFKAFFQTIGQGFDTSGVTSAWNSALDTMTDYGIAFLKGFYGSIEGTNDAIVATWQQLPAAFGDVFIQALNYAIDGYNAIVQAGWSFLGTLFDLFMNIPGYAVAAFNGVVAAASAGMSMTVDMSFKALAEMLNAWRTWPAAIGQLFWDGAKKAFDGIVWLYNQTVSLIKNLVTGNFGQISNPFAGAGAKAAKDGAEAFAKGYDNAGKKLDEFGAKWSANSRKIAQQRILGQVGPHGADPKAKKGGKTDAEKFADIVGGANRDIASVQAEIKGIDLTADAATRLKNEQKLLNEADQKGIKLTAEQRAQLIGLADKLSDLQVNLKNLQGFKDIREGAAANLAALKAESDQIGLYGEALARAKYEQELLNQAKQKHIDLSGPQMETLKKDAAALAAQDTANARKKYYEDTMESANRSLGVMQQEQAQLGLSEEAVTRLRYQQDLLNDAKAKHIELTPAQIASLSAVAAKMAETDIAIRRTREALDFAKDSTRGFFGDLIDGARKGQNIFQTFGNALMNVLDKLLNKMVDFATEAAFNGGTGGGGGFFNSLLKIVTGAASSGGSGGITTNHAGAGNVKAFAKGGVVGSPVMFDMAGGRTGVAGEAGPEGVLPLQRGPDGSLGVQMYGGKGGSSAPISNTIQLENHYHISGAISSEDVNALVRQGAERSVQQVKRSISGWLQTLQDDGTIV